MAHRALACLICASFLLAGFGACSKEAPSPGPMVKKMAPKPNAAPVASAAAENTKKATPETFPAYDPTGRRDPFVSFVRVESEKLKTDVTMLPPLQRYELGELKYVGVIWERRGARALVEDGEGKGYSVLVGTHIGRNGGVVSRITDKEIVVREEFPGVRGKTVYRERALQLTTAGGN
jgi:Tfp pilus assembly protein PilP